MREQLVYLQISTCLFHPAIMSYRTPMRTRSTTSHGSSTPSLANPPRSEMRRLERPPSRTFRPASPRHPGNRSRPGSSLGSFPSSDSANSRPSTPSFRQEPYTGNIAVLIRPNPQSVLPNSPWSIDSIGQTITNTTDFTSYSFDNVFPADAECSNRFVYDRAGSELVKKFLNEGYNATIFAYGMTGSGKTFSMKGNNSDPGFVQLAIDDLFAKIESDSREYSVSVNYLEIYNEKIIDLLSTGSATDLKIREDLAYGNCVVGVNSPSITSKDQLLQLIRKGDTNRKTSVTDYNHRSSRSHSILQIRVSAVDRIRCRELNATLSLCDLAGSERATSSLERLKEGAYINKSLLALSTVINKLSLASTTLTADHIPYRDSKLTRLLQPALSGSSLVLILCTVHLGSGSGLTNQHRISETYNTLRFAARAKDIVVSVNKNQMNIDEDLLRLVETLRRTIETQKNEITMLKQSSTFSGETNGNSVELQQKEMQIGQLQAELAVCNERLEHFARLTDLQKTETIMLKNDTVNDILGSGAEELQMIMANFEEFHRRLNYELEESKLYISQLEMQLRNALSHQQPVHRSAVPKEYETRIKDQEEEIWHLKELLKDKDHVIKSLTKTSKLRRLADSTNTDHRKWQASGNEKDSPQRPLGNSFVI